MCVSWTIKSLILLMHGATMKFTGYVSLFPTLLFRMHFNYSNYPSTITLSAIQFQN